MKIEIKKFGAILISRQLGREAFAAFKSDYKDDGKEEIKIDFSGLEVLSPSWADEFITPLQKIFGSRLLLLEGGNSSVRETILMLEKANNIKFNISAS